MVQILEVGGIMASTFLLEIKVLIRQADLHRWTLMPVLIFHGICLQNQGLSYFSRTRLLDCLKCFQGTT